VKCSTRDAIFAVLCGCGHDIRKILTHIRALLALIFASVLATISGHFLTLQVDLAAKPARSYSSGRIYYSAEAYHKPQTSIPRAKIFS